MTWPNLDRKILKIATPTNKTELESFGEFLNFYMWYVQKYTDVTEPFVNLRKKNVEFFWSEKQKKNAFDRLKVIMAKKPLVKMFDPKKGHYVNQRCKWTFNSWNIITRMSSGNVFIKKTR